MSVRFLCRMMLLLVGAASFRVRKKSSTARSIEIYTWGNPKTTVNHKKWPRSGCFLGLRAETEDYRQSKNNIKDVVSWLLSTYRHPEMPTIRLLDDPSRTEVKPCHWNRANDPQAQADPIARLHAAELYINRSMAYGGPLSEMADIGLRNSYEMAPDPAEIRSKGWNLVDSAIVKEVEVSHLYQKPDTLECMLSFEGTDRTSEWFENINLGWKTFCGNGYFHSGFRNVVLSMTKSSAFKTKIRSKLGACSKISAVGHSLGGAMAIMWAGCVLSNNEGRTDYDNLKFTWRKPELLPSK